MQDTTLPTATPTNTETPTYTPTHTDTPTYTPTDTDTPTYTPTGTDTPTYTPTDTPTYTPTGTDTPTYTPTNTATPTFTPTNTPTDTPTLTPTDTNTPTYTPTDTDTPTYTPTHTDTPTYTPTDTDTPTYTPTGTDTPTYTPTDTPTYTPTHTDTPTYTPTDTDTPTYTLTNTPTYTPTLTPTDTNTPTYTPTDTDTPTYTPTDTNTPTFTPTNTATQTSTPTNTPTDTPTLTPTDTNTPTYTPTDTDTPTYTPTDTNTPTFTPTNTATQTSTPTNTLTDTPTLTPTDTDTPTYTPTASLTLTPSATITLTPTYTPTPRPTFTPSSTATQTPTITPRWHLYNPPFGVKVVDSSGLPNLVWTMYWINGLNHVAVNAAVHDSIPAGTTYMEGSLSCMGASTLTTTTSCLYEKPSLTYPRGRVVWTGSIAPDFGAKNVAAAKNELIIQFKTSLNSGVTSATNKATIDSDLNGNGNTTDPGEQNVGSASATWSKPKAVSLPSTGFAPNRVTFLTQPSIRYANLGTLWLEIPRMGVELPIVGVPQSEDGTWDVSWLGNDAGWLNGSAFPTHSGNSVLTGHVYDAYGRPGPFVHLNGLWYGDEIIVHAWGVQYVYEVRSVLQVSPDATATLLKHEDLSWVTLVTCRGYDETSNSYKYRIIVRAVLVQVK